MHLARRSFVKDYTKNWQYKLERNSLVTIENLLGAERIAKNIKGKKFIYIFSEKSRERKIKIFAKNIFKKNFKAISIDFDLSSNRYLESEFIRKKEDFSIKYELKALKDKDLYKKFRKIIEDRMIYYRKQGHNKHIESIHQWWKDKLKELEN